MDEFNEGYEFAQEEAVFTAKQPVKTVYELFLSTDGKHTVHVKTTEGGQGEALKKAMALYDIVASKYGSKTNGKSAHDGKVPETRDCKIHGEVMTKAISKKSGKPYFSHKADGEMCFGS